MRPTDQALLLALERQREGRESRLPVLGRRDTVPAALHDSSTTQADSRGLLRSHEDNKLEPNPISLFGLGAKVVRRHHLTKRAGSGSTPAASTSLFRAAERYVFAAGVLLRIRENILDSGWRTSDGEPA